MLKKLLFILLIFTIAASSLFAQEIFQVTGTGKTYNEAREDAYQKLIDKIYGSYIKSTQTVHTFIDVNGEKELTYEEYIKVISSGLVYARIISYRIIKGEWREPDKYEVDLKLLPLEEIATSLACELLFTEASLRECRDKYLTTNNLKNKGYLVEQAENFLYKYRGLITTIILLGEDPDEFYKQDMAPAVARCKNLVSTTKELREITSSLQIMYEEDQEVF